jgi:hypothetical protein
MFNQLEGMLQRITTGEVDASSVSQAAQQQVSGTDHNQLLQQVQQAGQTATNAGDTNVGQQLISLASEYRSNPEGFKQQVVSFIATNPQVLQHFEPAFASDVLKAI